MTVTVTMPSSGAVYSTAPNDTVTSGSSSSPMFTVVSSVGPSDTLRQRPEGQLHALVVIVHRILCGREGERPGGLPRIEGHAGRNAGVVRGSTPPWSVLVSGMTTVRSGSALRVTSTVVDPPSGAV